MARDLNAPLFTAVSSSARQLFLLLRCISFASKAHVRVSPENIRFSVEETSVLEGRLSGGRSSYFRARFLCPSNRSNHQ